jgi:hypothetical protein
MPAFGPLKSYQLLRAYKRMKPNLNGVPPNRLNPCQLVLASVDVLKSRIELLALLSLTPRT